MRGGVLFLVFDEVATNVDYMNKQTGTDPYRRQRPTKAELHQQQLKRRRKAREMTRRNKRQEYCESIDWFVTFCKQIDFKDVPHAWNILGMIFAYREVHQDVRDYASDATDQIFPVDSFLIEWGMTEERDDPGNTHP